MSKIRIPEDYKPQLNLIETEVAVKMIKDTFERRLAELGVRTTVAHRDL